VTSLADVVLPVASVTERSGTFLNWEGRFRPFTAAMSTSDDPDHKVLHNLAHQMGVELGTPDVGAIRLELQRLGVWDGATPALVAHEPVAAPKLSSGEVVLAGWRMLLDLGRLQDGEPYLAGTARRPVVRLSAGTAAGIGAGDGEVVSVSSGRGAVSLPLVITEMPDGVAWLPLNSPGSAVHEQLAVTIGAVVQIERGAMA
jgi:NADH-quinone oxidoreductase subunit G